MCAYKYGAQEPTKLVYTYKNHVYEIVSENVRMKDSSTGEWYDGIAYRRADKESPIYVRKASTFKNAFQPLHLEGNLDCDNIHIR